LISSTVLNSSAVALIWTSLPSTETRLMVMFTPGGKAVLTWRKSSMMELPAWPSPRFRLCSISLIRALMMLLYWVSLKVPLTSGTMR